MGQHKHNPNVALAKEGKLPPKIPEMSQKQKDLLAQEELYNIIQDRILKGYTNRRILRGRN